MPCRYQAPSLPPPPPPAQVAPLDVVPSSFIPALFAHATEDAFITISHSEKLHAAYAGDKNLIRFEGDHNSRRPKFFYSSVSVFFHNTLQVGAAGWAGTLCVG